MQTFMFGELNCGLSPETLLVPEPGLKINEGLERDAVAGGFMSNQEGMVRKSKQLLTARLKKT